LDELACQATYILCGFIVSSHFQPDRQSFVEGELSGSIVCSDALISDLADAKPKFKGLDLLP
jgi:hypothetical protein